MGSSSTREMFNFHQGDRAPIDEMSEGRSERGRLLCTKKNLTYQNVQIVRSDGSVV